MKWISVKDKMPKETFEGMKDKHLGWLAFDGNMIYITLGWLVFDGSMIYITHEHPTYWNKTSSVQFSFSGEKITHWMPLPKPPKIEEIKKGKLYRFFKRLAGCFLNLHWKIVYKRLVDKVHRGGYA